jgi:hypothetical protein
LTFSQVRRGLTLLRRRWFEGAYKHPANRRCESLSALTLQIGVVCVPYRYECLSCFAVVPYERRLEPCPKCGSTFVRGVGTKDRWYEAQPPAGGSPPPPPPRHRQDAPEGGGAIADGQLRSLLGWILLGGIGVVAWLILGACLGGSTQLGGGAPECAPVGQTIYCASNSQSNAIRSEIAAHCGISSSELESQWNMQGDEIWFNYVGSKGDYASGWKNVSSGAIGCS